jgi:glucosamine-6-phosphate deaminase
LGAALAEELLDGAASAEREGRAYVIGCPSGRSLKPTYRAFASMASERRANFSNLHIALMDEFVERTATGWQWIPADRHCSCIGFARREIIDPLNEHLPVSHKVPAANILAPPPGNPVAFERRIEMLGGIDLFLLASGTTDGHVAFNPPGTRRESETRIIELAETTRCDSRLSFPELASTGAVPSHGVSVGLGTIKRFSRETVLVMTGEDKAHSLVKIAALERFDTNWPASIIHCLPPGRVMVDKELAGTACAMLTARPFQ